jgi:hypothetical protein
MYNDGTVRNCIVLMIAGSMQIVHAQPRTRNFGLSIGNAWAREVFHINMYMYKSVQHID